MFINIQMSGRMEHATTCHDAEAVSNSMSHVGTAAEKFGALREASDRRNDRDVGRSLPMLSKDTLDKELAPRFCAAFLSYPLGVTVATQYKNTPEDVDD